VLDLRVDDRAQLRHEIGVGWEQVGSDERVAERRELVQNGLNTIIPGVAFAGFSAATRNRVGNKS
jgi:hypothetical protein